jgi:hypothetical protein
LGDFPQPNSSMATIQKMMNRIFILMQCTTSSVRSEAMAPPTNRGNRLVGFGKMLHRRDDFLLQPQYSGARPQILEEWRVIGLLEYDNAATLQ